MKQINMFICTWIILKIYYKYENVSFKLFKINYENKERKIIEEWTWVKNECAQTEIISRPCSGPDYWSNRYIYYRVKEQTRRGEFI